MRTASKAKTVSAEVLEAEKLDLRYMLVTEAVLYEDNSKKHDIGSIASSIRRYGFRNPPLWDKTINRGSGGIVAGNGRIETLAAMEKQGQSIPRCIATDAEGRWYVPIVFGCDAIEEAEAIAYSIDDNNLTLLGGEFTVFDAAKMWESDSYISALSNLDRARSLPESVDKEAFQQLISPLPDKGSREGMGGGKEMECVCPSCGHAFIKELGGGHG
jgi:hypothetical protein